MKHIFLKMLGSISVICTLHGMHEITKIYEKSPIKHVGFSNDSSLVYANTHRIKKYNLEKKETINFSNVTTTALRNFENRSLCASPEYIFCSISFIQGIQLSTEKNVSWLRNINARTPFQSAQNMLCNDEAQCLVVGVLHNNSLFIYTSDYQGNTTMSEKILALKNNKHKKEAPLPMAFNPCNHDIFICNASKIIRYNSKKNVHNTFVKAKHRSLFDTISISPTYVFLATLTTDKNNQNPKIQLWNLHQYKALFALPLPQETSGTTLAFTKNADFVICGLANGTVQFWPTAAQHDKPIYSCSIAQDPITHIALDKSGELLAVAHKNSITIKNINQLLATVLASPLKAHHALQKMRTQQQLTDIIIQHK